MPRVIHTHSLRYKLAQLWLTLLYGRPWHYISLWPKSGISSVIFPVNEKRVLLGLRAGNIENVGCWSGIGGFVELPIHETFAEAAVRELFEETGLRISAEKFPASPHAVFVSYQQKKKYEMSDVAAAYYYFAAPDDFLKRLELQEETADFQWFTQKECEAMIEDGRIPAEFTDLHASLAELFRRLNSGQKLDPMPL